MVRISRKACCVTSWKTAAKETTSLQNPTSTQFPFHVQKQSKTIEKTTLNWEIGPSLVYFHAVNIINHLHLALLSKNKRILHAKRRKKTMPPGVQKACQVCAKFYWAYYWYLHESPHRLNHFSLDLSIWPCTEPRLARLLNHLTLD